MQIGSLEPWHGAGASASLIQADVHWWDWTTPVAEIMQGLNNLVKMGKGERRRCPDHPSGIRIGAVLTRTTQCSTLVYPTLRLG
jgi:hypothetical protein